MFPAGLKAEEIRKLLREGEEDHLVTPGVDSDLSEWSDSSQDSATGSVEDLTNPRVSHHRQDGSGGANLPGKKVP